MCYGDPDHGSDGYYRAWLEQQHERQIAEREAEEAAEREADEAFPGQPETDRDF